jgi:hypothetical protein
MSYFRRQEVARHGAIGNLVCHYRDTGERIAVISA